MGDHKDELANILDDLGLGDGTSTGPSTSSSVPASSNTMTDVDALMRGLDMETGTTFEAGPAGAQPQTMAVSGGDAMTGLPGAMSGDPNQYTSMQFYSLNQPMNFTGGAPGGQPAPVGFGGNPDQFSSTQFQSLAPGFMNYPGMPGMPGLAPGMPGMGPEVGAGMPMGMPTDAGALPLCAQCGQPIAGKCLTAVGKKWHPEHFVCAKCFTPFGNRQFFEAGGRPYCEMCYYAEFGPKCACCGNAILGKCVSAMNKKYHPECFNCGVCNKNLAGAPFVEKNGSPFCKECAPKAGTVGVRPPAARAEDGQDLPVYQSDGSVPCDRCHKPIQGDFVVWKGEKSHPNHHTCSDCHMPFRIAQGMKQYDGKLYCEKCFGNLMSSCCNKCRRPIAGPVVNALGKQWHSECFVCAHCNQPFKNGTFYEKNGRAYCEQHYHMLFGTLCGKCQKAITGRGVTALGKQWHPECFVCVGCDKPLAGGTFCEWDGKPMCKRCFLKLPPDLRKKLGKKREEEAKAAAAQKK